MSSGVACSGRDNAKMHFPPIKMPRCLCSFLLNDTSIPCIYLFNGTCLIILQLFIFKLSSLLDSELVEDRTYILFLSASLEQNNYRLFGLLQINLD